MRSLKFSSIFLLLFLIAKIGYAQLIQRNGSIITEISSRISSMPIANGDNYIEPDSLQLNIWGNALKELFLGNYNSTSDSTKKIGYQLVQFTDTLTFPNNTYYILETIDSNYWGTYVYNPNFCRPLVIQSPHAVKDINTGLQGIHVFRKTNALFFQVNGTNRCNSPSFSGCSGTSSNCTGSSEPYRISDLAHTTQSLFQKTTAVLLNQFSNTYFFQLHGFNKQVTDPYIILSNGTQQSSIPDFFPSFASNLHNEDSVLTFRIAHIDTNWNRLRGFFNTQSRLVNGSSNHCNTNASTTNGRFFHMEQERTRLRSDSTGWNKVANALASTFPCTSVSISEYSINNYSPIIYPNPAENFITIDFKMINRSVNEIKLYNIIGQNMNEHVSFQFIENSKVIININQLSRGFYVLRLNGTSSKFYKK